MIPEKSNCRLVVFLWGGGGGRRLLVARSPCGLFLLRNNVIFCFCLLLLTFCFKSVDASSSGFYSCVSFVRPGCAVCDHAKRRFAAFGLKLHGRNTTTPEVPPVAAAVAPARHYSADAQSSNPFSLAV